MTAAASTARTSSSPAPVRAEQVSTWARRSPSSVDQPAQVVGALGGGERVEGVDLVEQDDGHRRVSREAAQVALVQGLVGVLLRVDHPDEQVDELDQPVDLEPVVEHGRVVVGQVEQDEPVELAAGPRRTAPCCQAVCRRGTPSHCTSGAASSDAPDAGVAPSRWWDAAHPPARGLHRTAR